jgi:hypothetical protein
VEKYEKDLALLSQEVFILLYNLRVMHISTSNC